MVRAVARLDHKARADYLQAKVEEALGLLQRRQVGAAKIVLRMAAARHQPEQAAGR
jgi:hypothetical protein